MTFVKFLHSYHGCTNDFSFIGYFTVVDIVALKLLCKETSKIFTDEVM
jgi:hypothetical protein